MNELLYGKANVWWGRLIFFGGCLLSAVIMIFCIAGIYNTFWGVPAKVERIAELEKYVTVWRDRSTGLDKYIERQKVAMNFSNFFMMMADPDQIINMADLEGYIEEKRHFCLDEVE